MQLNIAIPRPVGREPIQIICEQLTPAHRILVDALYRYSCRPLPIRLFFGVSEDSGDRSEEQIVELFIGLPWQLAGEHTPSPRQRARHSLNVKRPNWPPPQGSGRARRLRPKYRQRCL